MRFGSRRRRSPAIAVVSMADVAFLLIVFFMIATTFNRGPQLNVKLPDAATGEPTVLPRTVTIAIDAAGRYAVDGQPAPREVLAELLRPRMSAMSEPTVTVAADRGVAWEHVVYAMDAARSIGVGQVELSVREPAR